jgi:hypothetical protein
VYDRSRRWLDQELRNRITVRQQHEHKHQHIPQPESIERRRHALRQVNSERIQRSRNGQNRTAMEDGQGSYEQQSRNHRERQLSF